jgi:hypothetical protein
MKPGIEKLKGSFTMSEIMENKRWNYAGIADCHGIESFIPKRDCDPDRLALLDMRCNFNRQRHAVVYFAELDKESTLMVHMQLKNEKHSEALITIQERSSLLLNTNGNSWGLIPNSKLDPWTN